jgi:predicted RNA-binding Zn-ribbon protein involved in translation (DUF1610 family)
MKGMNINTSGPIASATRLLHFHVCADCGNAFRREEIEGRAHTTGIFVCPKCGAEGPLNLEIRDMGESGPCLPKGK